MDIVFICGLFPKNRTIEIARNSKNIIHTGPNKLQWTFVNGLKLYFNQLTVITTPLLSNFPLNYKRPIFWGSNFSYTDGISGKCLGSVRLPLIGLISKFLNITFYLFKKFLFKKDLCFLIYSVHLPYLLSAVLLKLIKPNIKICLFVNDLPQYMSENKSKIYLFLKSIELFLFNLLQKKVDYYIFVTTYLNDLINKSHKPWVLVEGVYDVPILNDYSNETELNTILYSGTLDVRYGIKNLIDSFLSIPSDNYTLWICGDGDFKAELLNLIKDSNRIKYFGLLSHEETILLQKKAYVLVNPRQATGDYTKYSFPIKTLEYLASGKPCIMYDLPGLPIEYKDYFITPVDNSIQELTNTIISVCQWDSYKRQEFCQRASDFIKENKSSKTQFKKIFDLLN